MEYRVEFTARAESEAWEAYDYIAADSPRRAQKWYQGLLDTCQTLSRNPRRCRLAPESDAFNREIRQLLYGRRRGAYRVLFEINDEENTVNILHVRHSARAPLSGDSTPGDNSNP